MARDTAERRRLARNMQAARRRIAPALLTVAETAVYLAIPFNTAVYKIYRTCEIPSVRLPGRGERHLRRVRRADLDALIEKGRIPSFEQQQSSSVRLPALRRV